EAGKQLPRPRVAREGRLLALLARVEERTRRQRSFRERLEQLALAAREPVARARQLLEQAAQRGREERQRRRVAREERFERRRLGRAHRLPRSLRERHE